MTLLEIFLIGIGLSMDAFAVATADEAVRLRRQGVEGELLVLGVNTVSYSLERDFALILVTALFLYPALLLADVIRTERQRRKLPETL